MHTISNRKKRPPRVVVLDGGDRSVTVEEVKAYAWQEQAAYRNGARQFRGEALQERFAIKVRGKGPAKLVSQAGLEAILAELNRR